MLPVQRQRRLHELDGLRGMAAAVVFTEHLALAAGAPRWLGYTPVGPAMAGFEAVILFFVLSGFVLALPYVVGDPGPHSRFLTRRFLRLWPAYAAAVWLACLLIGVSPVAAVVLVISSAGLLVAGSHVVIALNTAFWSLIHEARASVAFPLLVRVSRSTLGCAVVAIAWLFECVFPSKLPGMLDVTILTLPAFVAGIRLAHSSPRALPRLSPRTLLLIAFVCVFTTNAIYSHRRWTIPLDVLAAVSLIVAARRSPASLLTSTPQYLGRISYSLYVIHLPLFLAVRHQPALLLPAAVASVALADLSQRLIEAPAIHFGRRLQAPARPPAVATQLAE